MPTITSKKQPTIAIITAHYCEKLAVDTMIENQETFVRYTTVGKDSMMKAYTQQIKTTSYALLYRYSHCEQHICQMKAYIHQKKITVCA